jgi:antirestriction protein ArdC
MAESKNAQQVREITDKLEQGIKELFESERFKEYLRTMSKFYHYSFSNTLLIAMQKPEATYVAGYTSWQRNFDRQVMKGEKGIKILAPAPYKAKEEREKIDPSTQKPVLDADGNPVTETVEVMRPAFKVVSVFDISQTDGKELPDIIVDELSGSVENYAAFFEALKQESPVPISFEDIPGGAKGYFSPVENRIAIQEGMSEIQTIKTAIHEIAHAKLHSIDRPEPEPTWKIVMVSEGGTKRDFLSGFASEAEANAAAEHEGWRFVDENRFEWRLEVEEDTSAAQDMRKDRHTKEVEAESVAYTVCQRYGIETSDYSFGYIAGWSSGKETKELKGSLETIRKTAAEMIDSIDAKLKVLLAEKSQEQTQEIPEPVKEEKPSYHDVPIYREMANYAYEAGELDAYRASLEANMACKEAIEAAISENYADYRLSTRVAVETVLEQFSEERVQYVLANTVQHNLHDGRYHAENKDWAGKISVCEENSESYIVSQVHPGLVNLFINQFKELLPEITQEQHDTVSSPEPEKTVASKHRLTPDEKAIKDAVMDTLKARIAYANDGMRSTAKASDQSQRIMARNGVKIDGNTVTQNGEPLFAIHRRYSAKKTQGCYRELTPTLEYIRQEKKQEKPSIRDQLKAAAKSQPEKKAPAKAKSHDMGLE